jgi:transcriptional regulator with XRE-family HTH domain
MTHNPAAGTLGVTLRLARERAGFSLRHLEAIVGVSRQLLLRLEHDELDNPSPALLHRLAEALELDSDDLFAFVGYQPSDKLPSLTPYLRAKYQLPPKALAEASVALRDILDKYDRDHDTN